MLNLDTINNKEIFKFSFISTCVLSFAANETTVFFYQVSDHDLSKLLGEPKTQTQ